MIDTFDKEEFFRKLDKLYEDCVETRKRCEEQVALVEALRYKAQKLEEREENDTRGDTTQE